MSDELNDQNQVEPTDQQAEATPEETKSSGSMKKYLLFGGIGIVVATLSIAITVMMMGGNEATESSDAAGEIVSAQAEKPAIPADHAASTPSDQEHGEQAKAEPEFEEFMPPEIEETDPSVLDDIMANLEFLDQDMTGSEELSDEARGMSIEDSVEAVN